MMTTKKTKPLIGYYSNFDPTYHIEEWLPKLTDINIITTKRITDEFIKVCVDNKHRIFLHIVISGMGKTQLEPNIPNVKQTFIDINKLISAGFPAKQILIIVKPIIQNNNGLNGLKLLLKLFTEFKMLRLRYVRFELLKYYNPKMGLTSTPTWALANKYIKPRIQFKAHLEHVVDKDKYFYKQYKQLVKQYNNGVITIDDETEPLIGNRELFPRTNRYKNEFGVERRIIEYKKNDKRFPIVDVYLSSKWPIRCRNRCILCNFK